MRSLKQTQCLVFTESHLSVVTKKKKTMPVLKLNFKDRQAPIVMINHASHASHHSHHSHASHHSRHF